ncbi:MAG: AlkA N-terminal domain-containing protein [Gemmatimonadaceae bacterium]
MDDTSYAHTLTQGRDGSLTWFDVRACPTGEPALLLNVHGDAATNLLQLVATVRRMFDLDADPCVVRAALERSAVLRPLVKRAPGVRIPGAFDAFEVAVRAVLGQQVTVAAGNTFLARLIDATRPAGAARDAVPGLWRVFPSPSRVADANLDSIGLTAARARTVRALAAGFIDGTLTSVPGQTLDEFVRPWTSVPGIGPWTAHYIALRALGHPDAFPPRDVALQRALHALGGSESDAESWRPWRGDAVIHLWRWDGDPGPLAARK